MKQDSFPYESLLSLIDKGTSLIKGVALRVGISLLAIVSAVAITDNLPYFIRSLKNYSSFSTFFSIYLGFICLFPRVKSNYPVWFLSTLSGVAQCLFLFFLGLPWQLTIFWGGLQTWLLRMFLTKFSLGWEWSVSLWLFIYGSITIGKFSDIFSYTWLLITIPSITFFGLVAFWIFTKLIIGPIHKKAIKECLDTLRPYISLEATPEPIIEPSKNLIQQAILTITCTPLPNNASFLLYKHLPTIIYDMDLVHKQRSGENTIPSYSFSKDRVGQKALSHILSLSQAITPYLQGKELRNERAIEGEEHSEVRYLALQELSLELAKRKAKLPQKIHVHIDSLRKAVQLCIESVQDNKKGFEQGERFLSRYLPASIKIIDNYIKLSLKQLHTNDADQIIEKLEEVLQRLERAFTVEYLSHVESNTIDLKADLATLDTLLRLKGY